MAFFQASVGVLKTLVTALGAGLAIWGVVNLLEGYGNEAAHGRRRCCTYRYNSRSNPRRPFLIKAVPELCWSEN